MSPHSPAFEIADEAPAKAPGGFDLHDALRFASVLEQVMNAWKALSVGVGGMMDLPEIKVRFRGGEYRWDMGSIKRTR